MKPRKIFIAGSTGATGRVLVPMAERWGLDIVPHVRPQTAAKGAVHPKAAVFDLADTEALHGALEGCTTIIQLIGTMRARFAQGDTYAASDIGTTRLLVEAGRRRMLDHFVLLSSVGADRPLVAYLKAKAEAESIVRGSMIPFTIVRPSSLQGDDRRPPPGLRAMTRAFGLRKYEPITLTDLSRALLHVAATGRWEGKVLEGESLWEVVGAAPPA
ncbi:MAG: NAD(P)H-binding protein [Myxococcales bacterium]|nr:NAD(P)H-binding protein [Myxococcales bacterium]